MEKYFEEIGKKTGSSMNETGIQKFRDLDHLSPVRQLPLDTQAKTPKQFQDIFKTIPHRSYASYFILQNPLNVETLGEMKAWILDKLRQQHLLLMKYV